MSIWKFADRLSFLPKEGCRFSLGEGNTPLIRSQRIGPSLGIDHLWFKVETSNPTGSYKDRFAAAAISHLVDEESRLCLGTSSGNAGAALAAYSATVGMPCVLAIVDTAPEAKLQQMRAYGAKLIRVRGFGVDAKITFDVAKGLKRLAKELGTSVQISAYAHAPKGMSGVETIAFELEESAPDIVHVFSPSGGGGLTLAIARGFQKSECRPAIHCVQPRGNNTIAGPLAAGDLRAQNCQCDTAISGLQVATVLDGHQTLKACRESGGTGFLIEDHEAYHWQNRLAKEEGVFAEPAGALALAGLAQAVAAGVLSLQSPVACIITGSGFKDDASINRMLEKNDACQTAKDFSEFEALVKGCVL